MRIGKLLLVALGTLAVAGVAYAAVTNIYVTTATITPKKSGTVAHPRPVKVRVTWSVSSSPAGQRPATVGDYSISLEGIGENTSHFPGCGTSMLQSQGPDGCPARSYIGGGFLILLVGAPGNSASIYNDGCRVEISIFNGGNHNLSLYAYTGSARPGQPVPCPIQGGHVVIDVSLSPSGGGLTETFSVPANLLHIFGTDSAVVRAALGIPKRAKFVHHRRVGLFQSVSCPPNGQRQVAIKFTREDGVSDTRTTLVPCT